MSITQTLLEKLTAKNCQAERVFQESKYLNKLEEKLQKANPKLGGLFADLRRHGVWITAWFAVLGLFLFLNLFIWPEHPHFVVDVIPWFWAVFGLGVGVVMIFVMKRLVQPLIVRKEDHYRDI